MNDDKSLAPVYRCQKKNSKRVDLNRSQFAGLMSELGIAIGQSANFRPEDYAVKDSPTRLRAILEPVYRQLAPRASEAFCRTIEPELMFGLSVEAIDPLNGVVIVSFVYEESRIQTRYQLQVYNHMAPYSEEWVKALKGVANGETAAISYQRKMALV